MTRRSANPTLADEYHKTLTLGVGRWTVTRAMACYRLISFALYGCGWVELVGCEHAYATVIM
jgi:hypothetical protein